MQLGHISREDLSYLTFIVEDYPEVKAERDTYKQSYDRCNKLLNQTQGTLRDVERDLHVERQRKRFWRGAALSLSLVVLVETLILAL